MTTDDHIQKILEEAGCCRKCCQRFIGEKRGSVYRSMHQLEIEKMESEKNGEEPARKMSKIEPCIACLGVLQDAFMYPKLKTVINSIVECEYDADNFSLTLSLPICLSIRHHSIVLYLQQSLNDEVNEAQVMSIKQAWKHVYPDIVAEKVDKKLVGDVSDFFVELKVEFCDDEKETGVMLEMCQKEYKDRAKKVHVYNMGVFSRQGVEKSLAGVEPNSFLRHYPVPPTLPPQPFTFYINMSRNSIFLGGRYNKFSRTLPQTPWIIAGVRKRETSLEEIIGNELIKEVGAESFRFLSSGREDVDVRMLGTGRPFIFECVNPKKTKFSSEQLLKVENLINAVSKEVSINSLCLVSKSDTAVLKTGEDTKSKEYIALCVTKDPYDLQKLRELENSKSLQIQQQTPIRVLHRRSDDIRYKTIHSMTVEPVNETVFKLGVLSSAGTYIKEFVHGDFGRTVPSLRSILGTDIDIMALDVTQVKLEWPPQQAVAK